MNQKRSWLQRKKGSIFCVLLSVAFIGVLHERIFADEQEKPQPKPAAAALVTVPIEQQLDDVISVTRPVLSTEIETLSASGNFQRAKSKLLDRALQAVANEDNKSLALHLSELGELALLQGDLGMAEVYLAEALELYEDLNLEVDLAGVHVQMGRLHLFARQRARQASGAYDRLLISRWYISQGRFYESENALQQVVETNLKLHRYGAAASAYETLYRGYASVSNTEQAQKSGIDAINLHATSGNMRNANRLLDLLVEAGLSNIDKENLQQQMQLNYAEYEASVQAIGAARDYAQLYNQLSSRGDALQAWRFRRQAAMSLANATKRAQYRRQADVLVELYRSNTSMKSAMNSLQKANAVYLRYGLSEELSRSTQLSELIF